MAREIAAAIDIAAPAAEIWSILTDLPAYASWNPFIVSATGNLAVGGRLSIRAQPPGGAALRFRPRMLSVQPEREFVWRGQFILPGLFDGEHAFRIEPSADRVRFVQTERFSGVLIPIAPASLFQRIQQGFEAMNRALKRRAEGG